MARRWSRGPRKADADNSYGLFDPAQRRPSGPPKAALNHHCVFCPKFGPWGYHAPLIAKEDGHVWACDDHRAEVERRAAAGEMIRPS